MKDIFGTSRPYTAAFVVMKKDGKVGSVLRGNIPYMAHHYGLPSGKVEIGEKFTDAVVREAKEEVGVDIKPEDLKYIHTAQRYAGPQDDGHVMEWIDIYFLANKWKGEPFNAEPNVHDEFTWLDLKNLPKNMVPHVKAALEAIEAGEVFSEYGWDGQP